MSDSTTKFVVIGDGRSGTTWIGDMLRNHPQIACLMEPFSTIYEHRLAEHRYYWNDNDVWQPVAGSPGTYPRMGSYLREKVWAIPKKICGVKLLANHLYDFPELKKCLRQGRSVRFVCTERNPLRKALSRWHAAKLGNWNTQQATAVKSREPGPLPWEFLRARIRGYERNAELLKQLVAGRAVCRVRYCHLVKRLQETMGKVCEFLGAKPQAEYTSDFQKMTPQTFYELVTNWEALKRRTPAEWQKYWKQDLT